MSRTQNCKGGLRPPARSSQSGFTLAGLIVMMTIIMMFIAYTVPVQWSKVMERERDAQTIFVMKQYARAIHNFRTKHNSLPVSLNQLTEARNPRMIRGSGEFIDPLTGEVDWIPVPANTQQTRPTTPTGGMQGIGLPGMNNPTPAPTPSAPPPPATGSPGTFVGPIIGVRPNKKGPSFLSLNGAETYEQWMFTINDLQLEIDTRRNGLVTSSSSAAASPAK